jgi:hypothetical protein
MCDAINGGGGGDDDDDHYHDNYDKLYDVFAISKINRKRGKTLQNEFISMNLDMIHKHLLLLALEKFTYRKA